MTRLLPIALTIMLAPAALAPATFAQPAESSALAGPRVAAATTSATLVERDMTGRVKRLDIPPEEAALAHVQLAPDVRAKVDAILAQRAAIMDEFMRDNLELVASISSAVQSGDRTEALRLLQEARPKLEPLAARGRLLDELKGVMPPDAFNTIDTLVKQYWAQLYADAREQAAASGERLRPAAFATRERLAGLGLEVRRAYDRVFTARQQQFERALMQLNLPPEHEAKVRAIVTDHVQATMGRATDQQNRTLILKILAVLDREKQVELVKLLRNGLE